MGIFCHAKHIAIGNILLIHDSRRLDQLIWCGLLVVPVVEHDVSYIAYEVIIETTILDAYSKFPTGSAFERKDGPTAYM